MKKIIKLSLAAALAATAMNAAVVDNVKMSGNAKLFYETNDAQGTMFNEDVKQTKGQVLLTVGASANVGPVKANVRHQTLTTAGLENAVVGNVQSTGELETQNYTDIANLSTTIGGTTLISGKQELNTPLCFTEKWNVTSNTFDANVLVNTTLIPNTTLIYADVKTTNGDQAGFGSLNAYGKFDTVIDANMVAASTTIAGTAVNAYYYDLAEANGKGLDASATWIDASTKVAGVNVKAIYAEVEVTGTDTNEAYAVSAATKVAGLNVMAAYSKINEGTGNFMNQATQKKTALPTQAVYVDGTIVAKSDAETVKVKVSGVEVAGVKLALQHVASENDAAKTKDNETDLIASTKVGPLALKALVMNIQKDSKPTQTNFRVVANYSF
jgi:hypothetical protein